MGADATASYIQDSADTDSALSISTTRVGIGNAAPASVLHLTGTMQVGVDGTGHDVIFYGDTAGSNMTWDEGEDDLVLNDSRLYINQDDDTYAIQIDSEATSVQCIAIDGKYGIYSEQTLSGGYAGYFKRDYNEAGSNACVTIIDDHANNTQPTLKIQQDGTGAEAIRISAAITTAKYVNMEDTTLTTGNLIQAYSNASNTSTRSLVKIVNDHASSTGTTALYVQQDSTGKAISATGGIVEEGGVLKENLLTNSGFDVWSNSTLEAVDEMLANDSINSDGSDTTGWNVYGNATLAGNQNGGDSGGHDGSSCITMTGDGATADNGMYSNAFDLVKGKLYKVTMWVKGDAGGDTWKTVINDNGGSGTWLGAGNINSTVNLTTTWAQYTWYGSTYEMAEATTATARLYILQIGDATGVMSVDDIKVEEVTPGCVDGSDNLACDGWLRFQTSGKIYRQHEDSIYTKDGSFYSMKFVKETDSAEYVGWRPSATYTAAPLETDCARYQGRVVTLGAWVYSVSAVDNVKLAIHNHNVWEVSTSFAGAGAWEWMELTTTINASATNLAFGFLYDGDDTDVAYVSQPMLVFGSSIGEGNYSRPRGEVVWFESAEVPTDYQDVSVSSNATINIEAQTEGKVPKGAAAIYLRYGARCSTTNQYIDITGSGGRLRQWSNVSSAPNDTQGWVATDSNGDIGIERSDTFSNVQIDIGGVQLR